MQPSFCGGHSMHAHRKQKHGYTHICTLLLFVLSLCIYIYMLVHIGVFIYEWLGIFMSGCACICSHVYCIRMLASRGIAPEAAKSPNSFSGLQRLQQRWTSVRPMIFHYGVQANPHDADVFVALGVMENINRDWATRVSDSSS